MCRHYRGKQCFQLCVFKSYVWTIAPMSFVAFLVCIENTLFTSQINIIYQLSSLLGQLHKPFQAFIALPSPLTAFPATYPFSSPHGA